MQVDKLRDETKKNSFEIFEKFTEALGIQFDSIQTLSDLEIFRRRKNNSKELDALEELVFLGKKNGINFISKEASLDEILDIVSDHSPAVTLTKELGWIFISGAIGPFIRITRVSNSKHEWFLKRKIRKILIPIEANNEYSQWILFDTTSRFHTQLRKNSNYMGSIKEFIQLEKKDIWAIAIYSIAIGILSLTIPIGVQSLVNILNFGTLFQPVLVLTFLVIIALCFVGVMKVFQSYLAELIQQRLFVRLAMKITNLFPRRKHSELQRIYGSELPNYFLDISIIQKSATVLLTDGLGIFLQTIIGLLVLVLYHPIFIIFNFVIMIVVIGIIFYLIGPIGIETSIKESKNKHRLASWFEEMNSHKTVFKSEKSHLFANLRTEHLVKEYLVARKKHFRALIKQMIGFVLLQAFGSGLLLGIGGWLVIKGQISLGQLVASEIIVAKILDNFGKFTKYLESYYDLCASLDKVNHLLDFSEEPSGRESQYFTKGEPISLKIKNLKNSGLPELNFEVEKGQIAIIQDESNKHSSIVLDLLFGLTQSNQGIIEINSFQLQDLEISEWRENVFLLRDLEIFSGSIADNLKVNKLDSDSSEIRNALERVGLLNKIQELPMGINTEILRNGYPFSNEELALLVFARAILTKPGLLLIDGLLAYLGKTSLNRILAVLKEEKKHSTIIISSTIQDVKKISDSVFTFKDGILKEKEV